jgi:type IV pilus assembly protein PilB
MAELKSLSSLAKDMLSEKIFSVGKGCKDCDGTGYKSRIGVHEVMPIDDDIRSLIVAKSDASVIRAQAIKNGMKTLSEDGFQKAVQGITTIEEILRIIHE